VRDSVGMDASDDASGWDGCVRACVRALLRARVTVVGSASASAVVVKLTSSILQKCHSLSLT
jgi:hypothetical protein